MSNQQLQIEIAERKRTEAELRESERRGRSVDWQEDFSQVKAAIDDLQAQGVRDVRQYLDAHREFVRQAISLIKVSDVNDATIKLFV